MPRGTCIPVVESGFGLPSLRVGSTPLVIAFLYYRQPDDDDLLRVERTNRMSENALSNFINKAGVQKTLLLPQQN